MRTYLATVMLAVTSLTGCGSNPSDVAGFYGITEVVEQTNCSAAPQGATANEEINIVLLSNGEPEMSAVFLAGPATCDGGVIIGNSASWSCLVGYDYQVHVNVTVIGDSIKGDYTYTYMYLPSVPQSPTCEMMGSFTGTRG